LPYHTYRTATAEGTSKSKSYLLKRTNSTGLDPAHFGLSQD